MSQDTAPTNSNPRQHTSPCSACPFSRTVTPGALGGSSVETYVGQVNGPFWLPCHSHHDYLQLSERLRTDNLQCAGAAIMRANLEKDLPAPLLKLDENQELVFGSMAEFYAHHTGLTLEESMIDLALTSPDEHTADEIEKARANYLKGTAKIGLARQKPSF